MKWQMTSSKRRRASEDECVCMSKEEPEGGRGSESVRGGMCVRWACEFSFVDASDENDDDDDEEEGVGRKSWFMQSGFN